MYCSWTLIIFSASCFVTALIICRTTCEDFLGCLLIVALTATRSQECQLSTITIVQGAPVSSNGLTWSIFTLNRSKKTRTKYVNLDNERVVAELSCVFRLRNSKGGSWIGARNGGLSSTVLLLLPHVISPSLRIFANVQ